MQINKITSLAGDASKKVGKAILNNKPDGAKLSNGLKKVNNFLQGESYNPGRGAYYALMGGFVIAPRLMQAREPDEFREILTRDIVTVLTILFAMKGLKSGMCTAAQKNAGLVLVKDTVGKNADKLKRLGGYLNPDGGIIALDSKEIISRYSRFDDKDSFVKTLKTLDKEGGDLAKVFNIENQKGMFAKIKEHIPFLNRKEKQTPLLDTAKKMFGDDFSGKTNAELIEAVQNITPKNKTAFEGLEDLIGSKALGIAEEGKENIKKGILNSKDNPLTNYARNISANFETLSLAITAGFLGFGLPKFNEKLTAKKHMDKPGTATKRAAQPTGGCAHGQIYQSIKTKNMQAFQSFMGNAK